MKGSYKKLLFFAVVFVMLLIYSRTFTENTAVKTEKKQQVYFSQHASGSKGEYWEYILSTEGILEEKKYYISGLGQIQNWIFTPIGEGEITITWNLYEQGGIIHNEKDSYSITYYFDKDGNYTVLNDAGKKR